MGPDGNSMGYTETIRTLDTPRSLLERVCESGATDDWDRLISIYRGLIEAWLIRAGVRADDLDDVLQDSLLALVHGITSFEHNGNAGAFRCWLRRLVVNRAVTHFRGLRRRESKLRLEVPVSAMAVEDRMLNANWEAEHDQHVLSQLLQLVQGDFSWTTWRAFSLQVFENCSPSVASKKLGISPNAAMIAKSRVLKRLRVMARGMID